MALHLHPFGGVGARLGGVGARAGKAMTGGTTGAITGTIGTTGGGEGARAGIPNDLHNLSIGLLGLIPRLRANSCNSGRVQRIVPWAGPQR